MKKSGTTHYGVMLLTAHTRTEIVVGSRVQQLNDECTAAETIKLEASVCDKFSGQKVTSEVDINTEFQQTVLQPF